MIETVGWIVRGLYSTTTLLSAGFSLLCIFTVADDKSSTTALRRMSAHLAVISLTLSCVWIATLAAELGGEWPASLDPYYYSIIQSSPATDMVLWRSVGLICLIAWSYTTGIPSWLAVASALIALFSFTRYGHSLSDPIIVRSLLLTVHLSVVAWWFAIVPTLLWLYKHRSSEALRIGGRFGAQAKYSVAIGLSCGIGLTGLQLASMQWQLQNSYAFALLIKLAFVAGILCIAAFNYNRAFCENQPGVAPRQSTIITILRLDYSLFIAAILASAWLTGPAANF